jgi:hypothetical protein
MAVIKKFAENLTTPLTNYGTFLNDTNPNSDYFRITEFKDTFTGGKNGFLIEGSQYLMESTELKVEILDVEGNPVYWEPGNGIPEYYEGLSKVIAVYIYEDTPIGLGKITILGEAKTYIDENGNTQDIPEDWKGIYNLKWERTFQINRLLSNEDKVRFYRRPQVSINEIVKPIFNNIVTEKIQTGSVDGSSQSPDAGQPLANYTLPTSYLLTTTDDTFWTGSIVGTNIQFTDLGITLLADNLINDRNLTVSTPYTVNGIVTDFIGQGYTASFNYTEGVDNLKTALTGSFAKITIADLTTFVGDVARVKVFRKSQSDLADFQFIQEIQLESNELLVDLESTTKNQEFYGLFDARNFKDYWVTSSNNLTTEFNQNFLFNSVRLDANGGPYQYFTTKSIAITEGAEYTLSFNTRLLENLNPTNYISAYISGSNKFTYQGVTTSLPIKQEIIKINSNNSLLQKTPNTINFKAENISDAKLYFEVKGRDWYVSDVSLRASQESAFSPDEITFIQPVPRTLPRETFEFLFQFYDINNNYIPVVVSETKTFDGGNLNVINKSIELIPSSLYFQFDSGSGNGNPVPPTVINVDIKKNYLTGSYTFTSRSFDFFGTELSSSMYAPIVTPGYLGGQFPGYLIDNDGKNNNVILTVQNFTGSRDEALEELVVQFIEYTVECEGVEDSMVITRVIDGKGGVNYEIRPYDGTIIRNSHPSSSLEVQAIRIDGVNEILLQSGLPKGRSNTILHVQSGSTYISLEAASSSQFVRGIQPGITGSGEVNYNAIFNRDSINGQLTLYMIPTASASPSSSILTTLTLTDIQDGLDTGLVLFDTNQFSINPRTETRFRPTFSSATASFYRRGTFEAPISCSFEVYPSMSINKDWVPEYWMHYTTFSCNSDITVAAYDENGNIIPSRVNSSAYPLSSPLSQSKQLLVSFTYTEPWTSASVSVDQSFTITPDGAPGDETIIFEVVPSSITLGANSRGIVGDYKPSITDIRLKQGSRYLSFTGSAGDDKFSSHGQFYIATASIVETNVKAGNVQFTSSNGAAYTSSLIVSASSNLRQLSGSVTYPLIIHPYFTSSIYTASVVVNYTKVLEGAPPIQVIITPNAPNLKADEVGYISDYTAANTTIQVKDGDDFLRFTTQSTAPGTFRIQNGASVVTSNIRTGSIASSSFNTATVSFQRFDHPFISASAQYNIVVYPYALGPGHEYTSSVIQRTQTFTKNVAPPNARSVNLKASYDTVNFNKDGVVSSPLDPIILTATATNTTGAVWFQFFKDDTDYTGIVGEDSPGSKYATTEIGGGDATGPGENATWTVRIRDGNPSPTAPIRAENSLTIAGIKAGADAYKLVASNESTTITADLWNTSFTGSGMKITTFKGTEQLTNVSTPTYNVANDVYDFLGNYIGNLGFSSASIFFTSSFVTQSSNRFPTSNPASIEDIAAWYAPAINKSGQIVYKIDFENNRQVQFVTQSISVQFEPPAPYVVNLTNENSSAVYKVSGQFTLSNTGTDIRVYRGGTELTNKPAGFTNPQRDAYGVTGYQNQCRVSIYSKSSHITLANSWLAASYVTGVPAQMPNIAGWSDPNTNPNGEIVYQIECEGRQTLYKTQSLSIQYEGSTGPGIVMRGEWSSLTDYSGSVETRNFRRDAVIYGTNPTTYYAAVSGSGPNTRNKQGTLVGSVTPTVGADNAHWQFLGQQEFFVAAKIAIFDESFVKNTINVGNNSGSAFANIVLAGGREDPYMAIGQYSTIGYGNSGIWLGIYDDGTGPTQFKPRFSLVNGDNSRFMRWTGDDLQIKGSITVTGGDAATETYARTVGTSSIATAGTNAQTALTLFSGSLGAMAAINSIEAGQPQTYIGAGVIVTNMIATNALVSSNYSYTSGNFTNAGSFFSLSSGEIISPGFAVKANGDAFFRGVITATGGALGTWNLDSTRIYSSNNRIVLNASTEAITVLDASNNLRFSANTATTLPDIGGGAPSPASFTPSETDFSYASTNGTPINHTGVTYYDFGNFTTATGNSKHLINWQYNPAGSAPDASYVEAQGDASANLYVRLVLRNPSTGAVLFGGNEIGTSVYGGVECDDGPYRVSVVGDTEITLTDGSIKLAKDVLENDKILSWDSNKNEFTEGTVINLRNRDVDFVYVVVCNGKLLKVSDSHTFWTYGVNDEIPVQELIAGKSKIYVKAGNTIELKLVDDVYKLDTNEKVYSFTVPNFKNYVSNNIISHNIDYPGGCLSIYDSRGFTDPTTFTLEADLTGGTTYQLSLAFDKYVESSDTISTSGFSSSARAFFKVTATAASIQRVSAGTVINGGGFQAVSSDTSYIRHMVSPTLTGIGTYVVGGLTTDKQYHPAAVGSGLGFDVGGYPMVKGYGRWTMSNGTTGTPATPSVASIGGVITSLTVGANQGRYTINYALTTAAGGVSTQTPSVFLQGIRESLSDTECTFDYGKRFGSNTSTTIHTQDNNVDTLNNMDELSVLLVM